MRYDQVEDQEDCGDDREHGYGDEHGDDDDDDDDNFARNPIEKLLSVYRVMQDPKVCLFIKAGSTFIITSITIVIRILIFTITIIIMALIVFRQLMVFQAGRTSAKNEAGRNFWEKLLKLLEITILVSHDDYIDDYNDGETNILVSENQNAVLLLLQTG